jgi:hypothetical protein
MNPKLLQAVCLAAMFGGPPLVRRDTPVADENEDFQGHPGGEDPGQNDLVLGPLDSKSQWKTPDTAPTART